MKQYTISIVGRPNTGKSTLFNKIVGKRISIIEDMPGVTRDRIYSTAIYNNKKFGVIDTGGFTLAKEDFEEEINMQVMLAIEESDKVLFVLDGKDGLTHEDRIIANNLRKSNKEIYAVINKIDSSKSRDNIFDYYELGFDKYYEISAENGIGVYELLNVVTKDFEKIENEEEDTRLKFSVIGRPNTGKSSLVNALLNEERVIVSDVSGTTRDAIDTEFKYNAEEYILIDTAGLRKKGRIFESVEKYSLIRSMKAIERSNVCLLVIDASSGIVEHDKHIASYALEQGKSVVIVVNKWDLIEDKEDYIKNMTKTIRHEFQFLPWASIVFLSAKTKKRIHTLMPEVLHSYENSKKEVDSTQLKQIIMDAYIEHPAPTYNNRRLKIYDAYQNGIFPPRIDIEVNSKMLVHFSYKRYLENRIRENMDFSGTPIIIYFKNKGE